MILYRPVGMEELQLMYEMGMRSFPRRKPEQPIFYPVLNLQYAEEIAKGWNTKSASASGYVTKFSLDDTYVTRFERHQVGTVHHIELWVPAGELQRFNEHLLSPIVVIGAYFGETFRGYVPSRFGLRGKDATAQFVALARTLEFSAMDVRCEIAANHLAVFVNYAFWTQKEFSSHDIDKAEQDRVLIFIRRVWSEAFPEILLPLTDAAV
jgi:hypothetical protein